MGGLVHCRACDRSARGRGGCDRRPLRICWRMGESGEAVLSICRVPFGVGARGQAAERVVSRGRAKRGGSDAACLAGKGQPGPADGSTRPPGPQSPGPEGATFPCSVSQKPVSFAPLRGNAAEAGLEIGNFRSRRLTPDSKVFIISSSPLEGARVVKGADCKSVGLAPTLVRIQPPPPETLYLNPGAARASAAWILKCKPRELGGLCNEGRKASGVWI